MQSWRRLLYFILLNILISALTTWAVITIVLRNHEAVPAAAVPTTVSQAEGLTSEQIFTQPAPTSAASGEVEVVDGGEVVIDRIIGAGNVDTERVQIQYQGDTETSLVGWKLQDEDGNVFSFPALTMFSGGAVTVYTGEGTSSVIELYWGLDESIWQEGEQAVLLDGEGNPRAVYTVP